MYLLKCDLDESYSIVEEEAVLCDEETVDAGHEVIFTWNKKKYNGIVLMRSDDEQILETELKKLKKASKDTKKVQLHQPLPEKRVSTKNKKWSPEPAEPAANKNKRKGSDSTKLQKRAKKEKENVVRQNMINVQVSDVIAAKSPKKPKVNAKVAVDVSLSSDDSYNEAEQAKNERKNRQDIVDALKAKPERNLERKPKPTTEVPKSPTKEELKRMLAEAQATMQKNKVSYTIDDSSTKEDSESELEDTRQTFLRRSTKYGEKKNPDPLDNIVPYDSDNHSDNKDASSPIVQTLSKTRNVPEANAGKSDANGIKKEDIDEENSQVDADDVDQLFGKDWKDDPMVLLHNDIYCKKRVVESALGASHKATHLVRRLLQGVFKPEALTKSTLTGQPPRSMGKERMNENVHCLNETARNAIIDYAMNVAKKKGWESQNLKEVKHAVSQKLGEIKREQRNTKEQMK